MDKINISKIKLRIFGIFLGTLFPTLSKYISQFMGTDFLMKEALIITTILVLIAIIKPYTLKKIYFCWIFCFNFLEKILITLLLGIIFIFFVQPISFITKLFGYDPLKIKNNFKNTYRQKKLDTKINLKKLY